MCELVGIHNYSILIQNEYIVDSGELKIKQKLDRRCFRERCTRDYQNRSIIYYDHWQEPTAEINIEKEMRKIKKESANMGKEFVVFAKSVGTALATCLAAKNEINPVGMVFCGVPYAFAKNIGVDFSELLPKINCRVIFIQNDNDPAMNCDDLDKLITSLRKPNFTLRRLDGDTHDYLDFDRIRSSLQTIMT